MARKPRPYDPHRISFAYDVLPWATFYATLGVCLYLILS